MSLIWKNSGPGSTECCSATVGALKIQISRELGPGQRQWYLSCPLLHIDRVPLTSPDLHTARWEAIKLIYTRLDEYDSLVYQIETDTP